MVIISGSVVEVDPQQAVAPPAGRAQGLEQTRSAFNRRFYGLRATTDRTSPQTHTDVTPTSGPGPTSVTISGSVVENKGNSGRHWFEKMHIYPGGSILNPDYKEDFKIEFGNILAQLDRFYEIYNAARQDDATLTVIDNNVIPGVETPEVSVPETLTAGSSLLALASQVNTDGVTGLGNGVPYVLTVVRALKDGLPRFDSNIEFTWAPQGPVNLLLAGSRVAVILQEFESPLKEVMAFATNIIDVTDGHEQRVSIRKQPREEWRTRFRLNGNERQRLSALIFDWQHQNFGLPLWHERVKLSANTAALSTTFQITSGSLQDFRVDGLAMIFKDEFTFDVLEIQSITDTLLTSKAASQFAYDRNNFVIPMRAVRVTKTPSGSRYMGDLEDFVMLFENIDNDTGAPVAATTWNPTLFNGRVVLDECNVMVDQTMDEEFQRRIIVIDNESGTVSAGSPWDTNKRVTQKGFVAHGRVAIQNLKAMLRFLKGKQKSWYLPSGADELTPTAALTSASQVLDIHNIEYARFVRSRGAKKIIRVSFTDNPTIIRTITSAAAHPTDSEQERLTIDSGWPNSQALSTITRIEFLELVRFDADRFILTYPHMGLMSMVAPVKVVFDDD